MNRRTRWVALVLAVLCSAAALSIVAARRLRPHRSAVVQARSVSTPEQLRAHCRDAVGPPRVERIGERVFLAIGYDLANTILIRTDAGNVVVDVSMSPVRAREVRAALTAVAPGRTVAVIYTHSHIDHTGGASAWVEPGTEIWATEALAEHFLKQYGEFRTAETRRGAGQYGAHIDESLAPLLHHRSPAGLRERGHHGRPAPDAHVLGPHRAQHRRRSHRARRGPRRDA